MSENGKRIGDADAEVRDPCGTAGIASSEDLARVTQVRFKRILSASPITTVEGRLHALAAVDHPGFELSYRPRIVDEYLRHAGGEEAALLPLWEEINVFAAALAVQRSRSDRGRDFALVKPDYPLSWVVRVVAALRPEAECLFQLMDFQFLDRPLIGQPFPVDTEDWSAFRRAAMYGFEDGVDIFALDVGPGRLVSGVAYGVRDADALAARILTMATRFEGIGGKVLVIHCNDRRARDLWNEAEQRVTRPQTDPDPEKDLSLGLLSRDERIGLRRILLLWMLARGMSRQEIARFWLDHGLVNSDHIDPEVRLASALKQVDRMTIESGYHHIREMVRRDKT